MQLRSVEGETFYFDGFKLIRDDAGVDVWADTTTLYVCIYRGSDATGPQVAQGILRIVPEDFAVQLTTMKATNPRGEPDPALLVRFAALFSRSLTTAYGHKLG
jgi:cholesterol oxidase